MLGRFGPYAFSVSPKEDNIDIAVYLSQVFPVLM